jgi:hypothetical protein
VPEAKRFPRGRAAQRERAEVVAVQRVVLRQVVLQEVALQQAAPGRAGRTEQPPLLVDGAPVAAWAMVFREFALELGRRAAATQAMVAPPRSAALGVAWWPHPQ